MAEQQSGFPPRSHDPPDASGASTCQSLLLAESEPGMFKSEHQLPFMIIFDLWATETQQRIGFSCPAINASVLSSRVCVCVSVSVFAHVRSNLRERACSSSMFYSSENQPLMEKGGAHEVSCDF